MARQQPRYRVRDLGRHDYCEIDILSEDFGMGPRRTICLRTIGQYVYDVTSRPGTLGRQWLDLDPSVEHGTTLMTGQPLAQVMRQQMRWAATRNFDST